MTKALVTLALLQTQWDNNRDYIDNFKPFVAEQLAAWPPADPVEAAGIAPKLRDEVGMDLPIGVIELLLTRLKNDGLLKRSNLKLYVVPEALDGLPDLKAHRERARNDMDNLAERVLRHAAEEHQLEGWDAARAMAAVERFVDALGPEFLRLRRRGEVNGGGNVKTDVAVVQSYARAASTTDEHGLTLLERAVAGAMLSTVLHFRRPEDGVRRLDKLVVYLDTAVVLHLLGVCLPQMEAAAQELLELLRHQKVKLCMFRHTFDETCGVLDSTSANLRASRSKADYTTSQLGRASREVLDHFLSEGRTSADVEVVRSQLEERLRELGIEIVDVPDAVVKLTLDEVKLGETLQAGVNYQNQNARDKDVDSITAIYRLRGGRNGQHLADCKAIFVTTNVALVRATRAFCKAEQINGGMPLLLADLELTTQLWIRTPGTHPDLPRKVLIADSFAALDPGQKFWDRCFALMDRLKADGKVTDAQSTAMLYSTSARSVLLDRTLGDPERLDEDSLVDVLTDYRDEVARPAVEAARAEAELRAKAAAAEVDQLTSENKGLTDESASLRAQVDALQQRLDAKDARSVTVRRALTAAAAVLFAVAAAYFCFIADVGQLLATVLGTTLVAAAACSVAWGWQLGLKSGFALFVGIGAVLAVPSAIYAFAERDDRPTSRSEPPAQHVPARTAP